ILERLCGTFSETVNGLADQVDKLEDEILAGKVRDQGASLGKLRRLSVHLRRRLGADRNALRPLSTHVPDFCDVHAARRLGHLVERLGQIAQELELIQDRTRLLQEELSNKLNEATNRNLYVISVASVVMLPITLITGIWGMNVGGIPWNDD